jgi:hypothetical protein
VNSLSDNEPRGQHPDPAGPEIIPFDLHLEAEVSEPHYLADKVIDGMLVPVPDDDSEADVDTVLAQPDGSPPAPNAGALAVPLTIRAPRGPQPVREGYTVAAVELEAVDHLADGDDLPILSAQFLSGKLATLVMSKAVADIVAREPHRAPLGMTHVVVNDHRGNVVYSRPLLAAA